MLSGSYISKMRADSPGQGSRKDLRLGFRMASEDPFLLPLMHAVALAALAMQRYEPGDFRRLCLLWLPMVLTGNCHLAT